MNNYNYINTFVGIDEIISKEITLIYKIIKNCKVNRQSKKNIIRSNIMKNRLNKILKVLIIFSLIILSSITGCQNKDSEIVNNATEKNEESNNVRDTLMVGVAADPSSLDPHIGISSASLNAMNPVFETLTRYDENGEIIPLLAESWEQLDDLSWKFNLRKGVKFHNGEEMKASDVVFSFKRATSPLGARVSYIMNAFDPNGLEIVDDYTVIIRTYKPFSPIIGYLPYSGAFIVSEKAITENPDGVATNPIGTGPFKFVEWEKNVKLTYVRNEDYWGEKPSYKNLIIRNIVEANSRVIELETGGIDIAYDIPSNDIERIESNKNTKIVRRSSNGFNYLGMNTSKEPFNNVEFRRAIDLAIDEESIVKAVFRGTAVYTPGPVTPKQKYFDDSDILPRYNKEEAIKKLEELGIEKGAKFSIHVVDNKARIDTATIIQNQLKEVGIELEIKVLESGTFYDVLQTGEAEFFISGWGGVGFPEPDNNIYGPIHSSQIPSNNYCFYSNPELDNLLDSSRYTKDGPEREIIIKDIQKLLRSETPYITIENFEQVAGIRSDVKGFVPTPASNHFVHKVYFE